MQVLQRLVRMSRVCVATRLETAKPFEEIHQSYAQRWGRKGDDYINATIYQLRVCVCVSTYRMSGFLLICVYVCALVCWWWLMFVHMRVLCVRVCSSKLHTHTHIRKMRKKKAKQKNLVAFQCEREWRVRTRRAAAAHTREKLSHCWWWWWWLSVTTCALDKNEICVFCIEYEWCVDFFFLLVFVFISSHIEQTSARARSYKIVYMEGRH